MIQLVVSNMKAVISWNQTFYTVSFWLYNVLWILYKNLKIFTVNAIL